MKISKSIFALIVFVLFVQANSVVASNFEKDSFVVLKDLQNATDLNGRPAMILGASTTSIGSYTVLVWLDNKTVDFKKVKVDPSNLEELKFKNELWSNVLSTFDNLYHGDVIYDFFSDGSKLDFHHYNEFDHIIGAIKKFGNLNDALVNSKDNEKLLRVVGAYLNNKYGCAAMKYVAENQKLPTRLIESVWDQIGIWKG